MSIDPKVAELLAPLTQAEDELASRRIPVDRERIVTHMVETALEPHARVGRRTRHVAVLAWAAAFALVSWGGLRLYERALARAPSIEVTALRGNVKGVSGSKATGLGAGESGTLAADGTLETSESAEARIKTGGLELTLLENTKISLSADSTSPAVRLEHGRVRCVISHQPGRTFSVITDAARVVDVGTTFSVSVMPSEGSPTTFVHVEEGEVLVQSADGDHRLHAADSWSSVGELRPAAAAASAAESSVQPSPVASSPRRELPKRPPETLAAETKLLRSGLASEQRGEFGAAAAAFQALIARYPDSQLAPDARAGLERVKSRRESTK